MSIPRKRFFEKKGSYRTGFLVREGLFSKKSLIEVFIREKKCFFLKRDSAEFLIQGKLFKNKFQHQKKTGK